jgi:hypothetical protein
MEGIEGDSESMGFEMPSLITQSSQIFPNYSTAGSPIQYGPPGSALQDDPATGTPEENDAKRRRIARVRSHTDKL